MSNASAEFLDLIVNMAVRKMRQREARDVIATVASVDPLEVLMPGPGATPSEVSMSTVSGLRVGDRVLVRKQGRQLTIMGINGGGVGGWVSLEPWGSATGFAAYRRIGDSVEVTCDVSELAATGNAAVTVDEIPEALRHDSTSGLTMVPMAAVVTPAGRHGDVYISASGQIRVLPGAGSGAIDRVRARVVYRIAGT